MNENAKKPADAKPTTRLDVTDLRPSARVRTGLRAGEANDAQAFLRLPPFSAQHLPLARGKRAEEILE